MPVTTVPDQVKKNIRAVLLSKVGGVLVSDLIKDYKSLLKEPLRFKDLGFSSIKEFVDAIPDVCRLEYDEGIMAHKLYGIGDKSSYMSLSQKRAEKSKPSMGSNSRNNGNTGARRETRETDAELLPNSKGLFTLCYPRNKEPKGFSETDIHQKFEEFGNLQEIHTIPGLFFLRFSDIDSAQAALDSYREELELRPASEKTKNRSYVNKDRGNMQEKTSANRTSPSTSTDDAPPTSATDNVEVFIGNIPFESDHDAFKEDVLSQYGPYEIRIKTGKGNDNRKIFAFVKFYGKDYGSGSKGPSPNTIKSRVEQPEPAFDEEEEKWDEVTESDGTTSVWGKIPREPITSPAPPQPTDIMSEQILQDEKPPVSTMEELHIDTGFHVNTDFSIAKEKTSPALSVQSRRSGGSQRSRSEYMSQSKSVLMGTNLEPLPNKKFSGGYPRPDNKFDDMPSLEPAGGGMFPPPLQPVGNGRYPAPHWQNGGEMYPPPLQRAEYGAYGHPPPLQTNQQEPQLFVSNFPYGDSDEELLNLFSQYGAYDIHMMNRNDPKVSTRAMIYVSNMEEADRAVMELNQMIYKGRRLLVNISKYLGNNPVNFLSSYHEMENIKCTVTCNEGRKAKVDKLPGPGGDGPRLHQRHSSQSSVASSQDDGSSSSSVTRSWHSMLQTYKIIMNTLHLKPYNMRPETKEIIIYITSVFDQKSFWGQIVVDEDSLQALTEVMTSLQEPEHRIGPTKGLGRCAALYKDEWYRAWIIGEKSAQRQVDVFFVDYGNTESIDKRKTSLTTPYIWETKPILQPFVISEGCKVDLKDSGLVSATVVKYGVDETGYAVEVNIDGYIQ
ncbi:uncharacterized protein LOC134237599 [Saccostrea cucullata]|uniref:uncharacterized protein LOC134237599 n=1 Tax=Saccostrea cuccullata TaxID=36930 RepID=UPI002ECFD0CE